MRLGLSHLLPETNLRKQVLRFALAAVLATAATPALLAAGHSHAPTPSVWTLNLKETEFGSGPQMKSDIIHLATDTDKWLKYTDVTVDDKGKTWNTSWSGPQDGTLKPISEMPGAQASFRAAHFLPQQRLPHAQQTCQPLPGVGVAR